jgi:nucleoside-diphosphate-sugar epimerase
MVICTQSCKSQKGTVLVIGSTGYVGAHVTKAFLANGYSVRATTRDVKATEEWLPSVVKNNAGLSIHELAMDGENGGFLNKDDLEKLLDGASVICFCAGTEKMDETTIKFMNNTVEELIATTRSLDCVARLCGENIAKKPCIIIASSTGSTNKPDADPKEPKSELTAWSDKDKQIANGRLSPAAKTIMETNALKSCGIGTDNSIINQGIYNASPRICIVNFSLILGPQLRPGDISAPGLKWFKSICQGQKMSEQIPNDSMSCLHVG